MKTKTQYLLNAVLLLLVSAAASRELSAQELGRIVYGNQTTHQIHSMNPDGSDARTLTVGFGSFPAWSVDKQYIAFHRSTTAEDTIYVMEQIGERNGGRIFPVVSFGGATGLDWAPTADSIVYTGTSGVEEGLWIVSVNPDTEEVGAPVLVRPGVCAAPTWSRDGTKIAFVSAPGSVIRVLDLATGIETFGLTGYAPHFSPDGTKIAFRGVGPVTKGNKTTWHSQVFVANSDGTGVVQLTRQTDAVNWPRWSDDGAQIAFWKQINGVDSIHKLDLATGATALVKKGGNVPDWAP